MTMDRRQFMLATATGVAGLAAPTLLTRCAAGRVREEATVPQLIDLAPASYFESQFGVTPELMREVIATALASGGDHCELYFQHSREASIGLEDGAVNRGSATVDLGVGVRVIRGDQTGYAYTEELERESMLTAARAAAAIADGPAGSAPKSFAVQTLENFYPTASWWSGISVDRRMPLLDRLNTLTFGLDPRVKKVRASFYDEDRYILIADSSGRLVADRLPMFALRLSCTLEDKGQIEENYDAVSLRGGVDELKDERIERLARTAVDRAARNFGARKPPAGELPVVLAHGSSGILLHEAIGHGMEADFNRKGISIYAEKMNQPIAGKFVSIIDDATVPHYRGSINVDDEGSPGQRTVLVENGVLRSYLHDRISAAHYRVPPTGNGRRESFRFAPIPRMRNTYMANGPHQREEIIRSVKRGVICETFTNGEVNIGAGDFTFYVKNGYLIEDGKETAPIKDFNIIGNGPDVLSKVTMVGDDLKIDDSTWTCGKDGQGVPVGQGLPTCLVSSITVGGVDA
ncbi:MAG: TldD/PmbA family protein [Deltaproteobacteria bacterium]|nr:TldD/PmbA family protein [Deltaproteobacteria bacterium]